jgi:hypothetical protein
MSKPIFKMFMARPSEAGYQLSQEERDNLFAKHDELIEKLGIKSTITCDSSWASDQYNFWGVEEYPDMDAVMEFHAGLDALNWFRYFDAVTLLGTRME